MKKFTVVVVVHGSGRTNQTYVIIADRISSMGNSIVFIKDNQTVSVYPADLTIIETIETYE